MGVLKSSYRIVENLNNIWSCRDFEEFMLNSKSFVSSLQKLLGVSKSFQEFKESKIVSRSFKQFLMIARFKEFLLNFKELLRDF